MKRLLAVGAAIAALGFAYSASAADLPVKGPVVKGPIAVPYIWTGFYVGAVAGVVSNFHPLWSNGVPAADVTLNGTTRGTFGGTVGYNWQMSSWLLGLEGDWSYANSSSSSTLGGCGGLLCTTTLRSFGTVRGRLGYLVTPSLLVYGTGGFAWADLRSTFSTSNVSKTDPGAAYGGGVEWMFAPHWTVKAEYLRLDLKSTLACGSPTCAPDVNASKMHADVFRGGVNYLFNWP